MLLLTLDLLGIAVFAVAGGLLAVRQRLDIVGIVTLATVSGLGGGWIRDVLIGQIPPTALADWRYLAVPLVAAGLVFIWHPQFSRVDPMINVLDAFGLGLFCVAGTLKAVDHGLGPLPAALLGVVTAVGGGMLRDVLSGRVPSIMSKGQLYAVPAMLGAAIAAVGFSATDLSTAFVAVPAATIAIVVRLLAIWRGWTAPTPGSVRS